LAIWASVEDLAEEGPESDGGSKDALAKEAAEAVQGVMDLRLGQMFGEGEFGLGGQSVTGRGDLTGRGLGGRMVHGRFLLG